MLKTLIQKTLLGTLPFTLVACGGGSGGGSDSETTPNNIPIAASGVDQNVLTGQTVTLDGSSSYDPDQDEISYFWSFSNFPASSQSTLSNEIEVNPSFIPDKEGTYILNLTVYDGKDYSNEDEVTIIVTHANAIPVAYAGIDQDVSTQSVVTLDGALSSDADGDNLSYQWSIFSAPVGSNIELSDATSVKPTFTPDLDGQYQIRLIVNDGQDNSAFDEVVITSTTANSAPVANAGNDRDVNTYELVGLDGSNSSDANGDTLSYAWAFVSKPDGSSATLNNANNSFSDFTPDVDGDYTISLVVNDGQVSSSPDNLVISATTANARPLADAGSDQVQFDLSDITLNGSGSSDADGDSLTYQWSIQSAPINY